MWGLDLVGKYLLSAYIALVTDLITRHTVVSRASRRHSFLEFVFQDKGLLADTFEHLQHARHCFKCFISINHFVKYSMNIIDTTIITILQLRKLRHRTTK